MEKNLIITNNNYKEPNNDYGEVTLFDTEVYTGANDYTEVPQYNQHTLQIGMVGDPIIEIRTSLDASQWNIESTISGENTVYLQAKTKYVGVYLLDYSSTSGSATVKLLSGR
jgi:hypothetical protein